jgi:hypothetical protein
MILEGMPGTKRDTISSGVGLNCRMVLTQQLYFVTVQLTASEA